MERWLLDGKGSDAIENISIKYWASHVLIVTGFPSLIIVGLLLSRMTRICLNAFALHR